MVISRTYHKLVIFTNRNRTCWFLLEERQETYVLKLNGSRQTLVRLVKSKMVDIKGLFGKLIGSIGVTMTKDEFKVVNPYTYSSNGRVNTMFLYRDENK